MKSTKFFLSSIVLLASVLIFSLQAQAALQNLGEDRAGNRLIYDTDFDITWYDYTKSISKWQNQANWADALSVTFGTSTYTDWRLPTTNHCYGYYCAGSEMWHLYNAELGNVAGGPLTRTGDFQNLQRDNLYWSGTNYGQETNTAWRTNFDSGHQSPGNKSLNLYALAVRDGMAVAVAPEPISSTLFIIGGATLGFRRFRHKINMRSIK